MKNLTRVLALVLTFAMMISTVAMAATFADIEAGSTYAEATSVLADLGILKGYEDGTFGADKVITRAEVVAVVNRLQGLSDAAKAAGGATQYTDVPSTEWYAGDVNLATQMGIISGDGNGLFRPNDQVKYEEAVKMVVAALGYNQEYVMRRGGWPTGYLVIATEAEISKGLSAGAGDPAYRGIVAKLAYNALTAPTFAFSSYSTDGKAIYTVNEEKIVLEEKLQTYKLTGYVDANAVTTLGTSNKTENDEVSFDIRDNKTGKAAGTFALGAQTFVTATDVAATLGFTADIYVKENADNEMEIISYVVNAGKNKSVVIEDTTAIQATNALKYASDFAAAQKYISVYDDETDVINTTYYIADNAKLIVNGQAAGTVVANENNYMFDLTGLATTELGLVWAPAYGVVELLDNGNDGVYDYVFVTSYVVTVVDEAIDTTTSKKIFAKDATIDLLKHIEGEKGFVYSLTLDGEEATIADLQENDVIAVAMSKDTASIDILATRKTAAGVVSESDKTSVNKAEWTFTIDGTEYKIANLAAKTNAGMDSVRPGDEVTLFLDEFGNIAFADKTSTTAKNYGFIVGAGAETTFDATYMVRLLNKEGNIETYELAENVRYAAPGAKGVITTTTPAATVYAAIDALKVSANNWVIAKAENAIANADIQNYVDRIVTYKTNSEGKITELVFGTDATQNGAAFTGKEGYLTEGVVDATKVKFNGKTQTFIGKAAVTEDTVVFSLPINTGATRDDFAITTIASLAHEEEYKVAFLSVDEDNVAGAIIIVNNAASVASGSNLAVAVKLMSAQNADFEDIYNVTFLQNGEAKTLATTADVASILAAKNVTAGDVFEYSVDAEGAINAIALGTNKDVAWNGSLAALAANGSAFTFNGGKEQYVYGTVYAKTNSRVLAIGAAQDTHAVSADANFYLVDLTKNVKNRVSVASFAEIRKYNALGGTDYDYAVFMKYYNDEITDVVIFKGANAAGLGR